MRVSALIKQLESLPDTVEVYVEAGGFLCPIKDIREESDAVTLQGEAPDHAVFPDLGDGID